MAPALKSNAGRSLRLMAACLPATLSAASHSLRPPKPTRSKLATFHKQFHRLVTQLDVYWKITDFPRAILVPDWGGEAVAHIIDLNYNWSPVSVYAFIYGTFALKYSGLCVFAFRMEAVWTPPSGVTSASIKPQTRRHRWHDAALLFAPKSLCSGCFETLTEFRPQWHQMSPWNELLVFYSDSSDLI